MAWSTREIAELAGTSLRAVRHYHDIGLLEEPERTSNGYKQYGAAHLVRVLRIKRLTDLGFTLGQIADMGDADDHPEEALRELDAELAATIDRLQRTRVEIGIILGKSIPADLHPKLASAAANATVSDTDRSFLVVMGRVLGPSGIRSYAEMLEQLPPDPGTEGFDNLAADADDATREALAERLTPYVRALHVAHPGLRAQHADGPLSPKLMTQTVGKAMMDLYNPAQIDVLVRVHERLDLPEHS